MQLEGCGGSTGKVSWGVEHKGLVEVTEEVDFSLDGSFELTLDCFEMTEVANGWEKSVSR